jgi:hypothetical protein
MWVELWTVYGIVMRSHTEIRNKELENVVKTKNMAELCKEHVLRLWNAECNGYLSEFLSKNFVWLLLTAYSKK